MPATAAISRSPEVLRAVRIARSEHHREQGAPFVGKVGDRGRAGVGGRPCPAASLRERHRGRVVPRLDERPQQRLGGGVRHGPADDGLGQRLPDQPHDGFRGPA